MHAHRLDKLPAIVHRLARALFTAPATGVMRHADAGYPLAVQTAKDVKLNLPMLGR